MRSYSNCSKKRKLTYMKTIAAIGAGLAAILFMPNFFAPLYNGAGYYKLVVNGEAVGNLNTAEEANEAIVSVRDRISREMESVVYLNLDYEVVKEDKLFGVVDTLETVEENLYQTVRDDATAMEEKAYTVKINDFTVTLKSKEDVLALLEGAKNRFDTENTFTAELVAKEESELGVITAEFTSADISTNDVQVVSAAEDGSVEALAVQDQSQDGMKYVGFEEDIEIIETYVTEDKLTDVNTALDMITKEKEENQTYIVSAGDCLSIIGEKNGLTVERLMELNPGITQESVLRVGDSLVITVPEPEVSVITKEQLSYEEDYNAPVQYVDNDSLYEGTENVLQEGTTGHRAVTALVSYKNGVEYEREILVENILVESQAAVVERGTKVRPTYIKPISGGRFTSGYGKRWGRMHEGIDWACSIGTPVMASCGGTVVSAGWSSGYGKCIVISHPDGRKTRYAHLSSILVSAGQTVTQGEKIGLSGNTGRSTGPHVHFEIIINGSAVNPFDYLN